MHIIFGSDNIWAQHELLHWFGMDSLEGAQRLDNGIDLHYRNPEETRYNDKQAHWQLRQQLGEDAAINIVLAACQQKSDAIRKQMTEKDELSQFPNDVYLICCDVVVRFEGRVRNSPDSPEQAKEFLRSYQGKSLECVAGVMITNMKTQKQMEGVSQTRVHIKDEPIPEHVLDLMASKEHVHGAPGGFVPDEPMLQPYVAQLEGSLDTVMGLPKDLTLRLLAELRFTQDQSSDAPVPQSQALSPSPAPPSLLSSSLSPPSPSPVASSSIAVDTASSATPSMSTTSTSAVPGAAMPASDGRALSTAYLADDIDLSTPATIGTFDNSGHLDDASRSSDALSDEVIV